MIPYQQLAKTQGLCGTQVSTRDAAVTLEAELKRLCDKNSREIRRRVHRFQDLVEQLDFS